MKFKDITCLSDIYYVIGHWFTVIVGILVFILLPISLNLWDSIFSFLMCVGIGFVGFASDFKDKFDYPFHYLSACISCITSIIWVMHFNPYYLLFLIISLIGIFNKKKWLLWGELSCVIMSLFTIIISIL